jgi:alkylation response protein AidB-like acyl-CoA dehydrogenase
MSIYSPGIDTEEQSALRDSVASLLRRSGDSSAVRAAMESDGRIDRALWSTLCEQIGVAALSIPEEFDGVGASLTETHVVLEELGRTLSPVPMLGSAVLATQALLLSGDTDICATVLPALAGGEKTAALCWANAVGWDRPGVQATGGILSGTAHYVLDGETADVLVVLARSGGLVNLHVVDATAAGITRSARPTMDPTRPLTSITFDDVDATAIPTPADLVDRLRAIAYVALSAEQVGASRAALDLTVEYTKSRKQFGRFLGSFQALKHRMADMYAFTETAHSISYAAVDAVVSGSGEALDVATAARVYCSDAFSYIASETIQLHGGIGITWEHDAHLYFKRAHGSGQLFGQPHQSLTRLATAAGL